MRSISMSILALLAVSGCSAVPGPARPHDGGFPQNRIGLYLGQRALDEDDYEPVDEQAAFGLEFSSGGQESVGWEFGLFGSYDEDVKYWERNVARRPEARLRIEGRLHDVTVTPVADTELDRSLDERYAAKYDMAEVFGDDPPPWRYYRVALRTA